MQRQSQQFLKKRKLFIMLPVLVILFLTLFFWAMGGGGGIPAAHAGTEKGGLNTALPEAQPDNKPENKLSLYQQALRQSQSLEEARRQDPYSRMTADSFNHVIPVNDTPDYNSSFMTDPNEAKVNQKLGALKMALQSQPEQSPFTTEDYPEDKDENMAAALDQIKGAMQQAQNIPSPESDPQLDKLDGMLQKIIDIQHPQAAKDRIESLSVANRGQVFSVTSPSNENTAELLQPQVSFPADDTIPIGGSAFYGASGQHGSELLENKAIPAVVHETQTLTSGATIKLRLTGNVYINGMLIPKGTFLYAVAQLEGERLKATVQSVRYQDRLFPVALNVYDMDGIEGIKIPGAITRDAAKQGMEQGVQSLNLMMMDQSLGAQAASAGIQTAKSFLGHKARLIRATVRADYPVLLVDDNKRND